MAGDWKFLICTSHRGAGTLNCSLFIKPPSRHSLMLQALFAFCWETRKRNVQLTFFTMAPVRPRESPHEESILCVCCRRCHWPLGSVQNCFTFLLTVCHMVPNEVEQLYQRLIYKVYKWVTVTSINLEWSQEGDGGGLYHIFSTNTYTTDKSGYLKYSAPVQTGLFLSGIMVDSHILKLVYCIYKPVETTQLWNV